MDSESVVSQVQRKIELQTPEDLSYLIANVRRAAAERLNEAFPVVEGNYGEDELRTQIEKLVNEVCLWTKWCHWLWTDKTNSTSTKHSPSHLQISL